MFSFCSISSPIDLRINDTLLLSLISLYHSLGIWKARRYSHHLSTSQSSTCTHSLFVIIFHASLIVSPSLPDCRAKGWLVEKHNDWWMYLQIRILQEHRVDLVDDLLAEGIIIIQIVRSFRRRGHCVPPYWYCLSHGKIVNQWMHRTTQQRHTSRGNSAAEARTQRNGAHHKFNLHRAEFYQIVINIVRNFANIKPPGSTGDDSTQKRRARRTCFFSFAFAGDSHVCFDKNAEGAVGDLRKAVDFLGVLNFWSCFYFIIKTTV